MSIHVALNHVTHYRYDRRVTLRPQIVRLRPAPHSRTHILSYSLKVEPAETLHQLAAGSAVELSRAPRVPGEDARSCGSRSISSPRWRCSIPFDFFLEPYAEKFPFTYEATEQHELRRISSPHRRRRCLPNTCERSHASSAADDRLSRRSESDASRATCAISFAWSRACRRPRRRCTRASGSCRDSAWLLAQLLRHLGLATRFVSGYLIQLVADVKSLDGPSGPPADFTDLHAWCEVYLPGAGWIGLDPTSGLLAGEGHIPLACTPEPSCAAPVSGAVDESEVEFSHTMQRRAHLGSAARHEALHGSAVGADRALGHAGR